MGKLSCALRYKEGGILYLLDIRDLCGPLHFQLKIRQQKALRVKDEPRVGKGEGEGSVGPRKEKSTKLIIMPQRQKKEEKGEKALGTRRAAIFHRLAGPML